MTRSVVVLTLTWICLVVVLCQDNITGHGAGLPNALEHEHPRSPPVTMTKPGALASFAKMFIDIPMGVVEAFKDGAEALESMVVAIMRAVFNR